MADKLRKQSLQYGTAACPVHSRFVTQWIYKVSSKMQFEHKLGAYFVGSVGLYG